MGVLETYWKHFRDARKPFTPHSILRRWAPPAENNTETYLRTVCRLSGLGGNENMPRPRRARRHPGDMDKMVRLITAMTTVECGTPYAEVDTEAIRQGFALAFPDKRSYARTQPATENRPTEEDLLMLDEYWQW